VEDSRSNQPIRFGPFEIHEATHELFNQGVRLRLSPQAFQVLRLLLQKPGHLITREEFHQALWPADTFVDFDHGLNNAIKRIRDVLNDSAESPVYIETLPRLGYRFIGQIQPDPQSTTASPTQAQPAVAASVPSTRTDIRSFLPSGRRTKILALAALVVAAFLVLIPLSNVRGRLSGRSGVSSTRIQSLAVLPLANLSGDPEQEYFADGMTEALITELGKTSIPRVISRQSVMQYKGSKKPLQEIGRELNVDAVLEGAVVRSGDRVRIAVRLDRASPEGQLWARAYDRSVRDILSLQDEIARIVTDEIQVKLTPQERAGLASARPVDPQAHDEYLRGRYILGLAVTHNTAADKRQYTELDILAAIGHFKHAIEIDPAFAMAYAGLADAHVQLGNPVWGAHPPKEILSEAKEAATKALDLDPSLAETHFSLAQTLEYEWNWSEAEKEFKLALKLNPNYADGHLEYGRFLQATGRNDEAMTEMNNAMGLDPFGIKTRVVVAHVTYTSRQYDVALKQFESLGDDFGLMQVYREKGIYPEALAALGRWKLDHPAQIRHPHVLATAAGIYGLEGKKHEAEKLMDELKETARHRYVSGVFFAEACVGLGQKDQAITWLEQAYQAHDQWMVYVSSYPDFDPLHSEPRFQALLRRMNFPK
jgi:TolB-like protein/DNA-binding winged helix-turn-helix (wHTH) protein